MILLIDNYDSFSYNLFQLIGEIEPDIRVIRNDELSVEEIKKLKPDRIILSPGPGRPEDAGVIIDVVKELMHGKQSEVSFDSSCLLFDGCPKTAKVARYHSLAAKEDTIPDCLKITSRTTDGEVMAVCHKEYPVYGVQFHPESIMTPDGRRMLYNFIKTDLKGGEKDD